MKKADLIGKRFGKWTVVGHSGISETGNAMWSVVCDCGNTGVQSSSTLNGLSSRQCRQCSATTHGGCNHPEYRVWGSMIGRCHNVNDRSYHRYGARGIYVCESWKKSYEAFIGDMGRRPTSRHSIDRIDNNGPYSKENCRWATSEQQANNKRNTRLISANGISMTIAEWAERTGIKLCTLRRRIYFYKWDPVVAVTTPVKKKVLNGVN